MQYIVQMGVDGGKGIGLERGMGQYLSELAQFILENMGPSTSTLDGFHGDEDTRFGQSSVDLFKFFCDFGQV